MPQKLQMLLCLLVLHAVSAAAVAMATSTRWQTHSDPEYGFRIDYPADMKFYSGHPDYKETQLSYIPICDRATVACFEYSGHEYDGTNFEAAGVSVNVLRDLRTEEDCNKIDLASHPTKVETIHGVKFHYAIAGEAGLGNVKGGPTYRAFHENVCFEVSLAVAEAGIGDFDPGTVKAFDSKKIDRVLDEMVHTFRFTGAVLDGPAWKTHYNNGCGGVFEYPDRDRVVTTIEYSKARFSSNDITCSDFFNDHGLDYTVAVKVDLKNDQGVESWLANFGYPSLKKARLVRHSKLCAEYQAGPYRYILDEGSLFILSALDANHSAVRVDGGKVFAHLMRSFEAN